MLEIHYNQAWIKLSGLKGADGYYHGIVREIPLIKLRTLHNPKLKLNGERVKIKSFRKLLLKKSTGSRVEVGIDSY